MNDWLVLILLFLTGALLAVIYLGGLWLTVQRLQHGRHPALWLITSLLLRMLLLIVAFYFIIGNGNWQHVLATLAGFIMLRIFTIRTVRRQDMTASSSKEKVV